MALFCSADPFGLNVKSEHRHEEREYNWSHNPDRDLSTSNNRSRTSGSKGASGYSSGGNSNVFKNNHTFPNTAPTWANKNSSKRGGCTSTCCGTTTHAQSATANENENENENERCTTNRTVGEASAFAIDANVSLGLSGLDDDAVMGGLADSFMNDHESELLGMDLEESGEDVNLDGWMACWIWMIMSWQSYCMMFQQ